MTVNFDQILETALKGIRRTAVFLGFGVNATNDPNFNNYSLAQISGIQLVPDNVDNETLNHFKENFSRWITGCGFRELTDTFSIFLDQICDALLHVSVTKKDMTPDEAAKIYKQFPLKGIRDKANILDERFDVKTRDLECMLSINFARNSLTHRSGVVSERDCNTDQALLLKWISFDLIATSKSGAETLLDLPLQQPYFAKERSNIGVRLTTRELEFPLKKVIVIPPKSLAEICYYILLEAQKVVETSVEFAKGKGINVRILDSKNTAPAKKEKSNQSLDTNRDSTAATSP